MAAHRYCLVVDGELDDRFRAVFEGLTVTPTFGRTVLVGMLDDQAQLQGLLQRIAALGLTLISLAIIDA